jgi:hypothetical protein
MKVEKAREQKVNIEFAKRKPQRLWTSRGQVV